MNIQAKRVLIVLDPRSSAGEAGIAAARTTLEDGGHVVLATFLSGPMAAPFHDEATDGRRVVEVAGGYLDGIADRLGQARVTAEMIDGQRAVEEIRASIDRHGATGLVLPATTLGLLGRGINALLAAAPVPIALLPRWIAAA